MEFCQQLKKTREILKMSQESMARELNVSFATINRLESKKTLPSYSTLEKFESLIKKYNIKVGD